MQTPIYELSILARAVAFKNLSGASHHIGLSQPQLSRILKKIEDEYEITLLDRSSKRNSSWTSSAQKLANFYHRKIRHMDREILEVIQDAIPSQINIGALEGLLELTFPFLEKLYEFSHIKVIELDVFDLDRLEKGFFRGDLDLIFSSREPGVKKHKYSSLLGYQSLDYIQTNQRYHVLSSFEFHVNKEKKHTGEKILVSNSLSVRKSWLHHIGGHGTLPSKPKLKSKIKNDMQPIFLLARDDLHGKLWDALYNVDYSAKIR
ncbi:MAG: LysR family transcriptional regulator [Oligoflexia bacterium]|nr:LysR family transcriptional regulator [Oligoflexia bacterium]